MLAIAAFGMLSGALCARYTSVLTIAVSAAAAAIGVGLVDAGASHSALHALFAGLRAAWSLELGLLTGLAFDQFVLRADPA